jgi:hypothetical protein
MKFRRQRKTTYLIFERWHGPRPFPRYSVNYNAGKYLVFRTFNTKLGCRLFARRRGRLPGWLQ